MTACQKIQREILLKAIADLKINLANGCTLDATEREFLDATERGVSPETIGDLYSLLQEFGGQQDYESEFRSGQAETGLSCHGSRHYESKSVAAKLSDGSWVGWTYFYGGGKHGEPEAIDWMTDAYELVVTEEERLVVVREFKRTEGA